MDRNPFSLPLRTTLLTAVAAAVVPARVLGVEAERVLSFNPGKFLIQPQFDASAQFNGNLLYAPPEPEPGNTNEVVSDLLWTLSPGLELQYGRNPEHAITASFYFDQLLYTENSSFNAQQERATLGARLEFGRFKFQGNTSLQWLDTILGGNSQTFQRTPISRFVWIDNYRLTYDATMKTDFYLAVDHNLSDFLQTVNLYDTGTVRGILGATYKPSEKIGVFVEGDGGHTTIEPNAPFQLPVSPSNVFGGFVGARGNFTPRLDGSVKIGYEARSFAEDLNVDVASVGSPAVVASLNYTQNVRRFFNFTYDRRVGVASQVPDQSYIFDIISLSVTQAIGTTGRWLVQVRGAVSLGNYSDRFINGINYGREDQTYTAAIAVVYQANAWLTASAVYSFEKYSALFPDPIAERNTGLNDYHANRFTLQVSVGY